MWYFTRTRIPRDQRSSRGLLKFEYKVELVLHVDDFLVVGEEQALQDLTDKLQAVYELKATIIGWGEADGNEETYLGCTVSWHEWGLALEVNEKHAQELLRCTGMETCKPVNSPEQRGSAIVLLSVWLDPHAGTGERSARNARSNVERSSGSRSGRFRMRICAASALFWRFQTSRDQELVGSRGRQVETHQSSEDCESSECCRFSGVFLCDKHLTRSHETHQLRADRQPGTRSRSEQSLTTPTVTALGIKDCQAEGGVLVTCSVQSVDMLLA